MEKDKKNQKTINKNEEKILLKPKQEQNKKNNDKDKK